MIAERWEGILTLTLALIYAFLTWGVYESERRAKSTSYARFAHNTFLGVLAFLAVWFLTEGTYTLITGTQLLGR